MNSIGENLSKAVIGIAGLGGLGSNVAVALARAGVGTLIIVDFDTVESDNLNRQHYFIDQVGKNKVDALAENLRRINPGVKIDRHIKKLDAESLLQIFAGANVIAECFDRAQSKQTIVETVLCKMDVPIVTVSGLAGYGDSNAIKTERISERLILVGDGRKGIDSDSILTAARVGIAACHQANAILELLIDGKIN